MNLLKCPHCWGLGREPPGFLMACTLCGGLQQISDYNLSEHFTFSEWCRAREGVDNAPDADSIQRARITLATLIEPARLIVGPLQNHSGYRCSQLDVIADGGNIHWLTHLSAHALGSAFDLQACDPHISIRMLTKILAKQATEPWDQIIVEGGCVHVAAEGPLDHGLTRGLPGHGERRKQILVRLVRLKDDPPGWKFKYEKFDDSDSQWLRVV